MARRSKSVLNSISSMLYSGARSTRTLKAYTKGPGAVLKRKIRSKGHAKSGGFLNKLFN